MSVVSTIDIVLMSVVFMERDETKIVPAERDIVEPVNAFAAMRVSPLTVDVS
jgi:hypothetical protein